ncbi:MAG: asparagine synthase (glutamine-hydrolyzing) [Actinobacteria bacterium]|nr:asparagine synthase (glutamine-hydrolyzing) [Actinomycetota bacterium]
MCGIAGLISLNDRPVGNPERRLAVMSDLIRHRGPDGEGVWIHEGNRLGFAHTRLAIIDLTTGDQPMTDGRGNWVVYNGEIYNYRELRTELGVERFRTASDTEVILEAYRTWGDDCVSHLRGMFAFALWDAERSRLFCARDRFGIKPFYYAVADGVFYFASEIKALLPFLPSIETDRDAFKDYLAFQLCLDGKTLFEGVRELLPGHAIEIRGCDVRVWRYWEIYFNLDWDHTDDYFEHEVRSRLEESVRIHTRADVPIGAYVSGGIDSSAVASIASSAGDDEFIGFTGTFAEGPQYDESEYARMVAETAGFPLHSVEITSQDFIDNIRKVIYHLDFPVAGPGSFPQYMVSQLAAKHRKVVLGGQGGDEIFGGYARYLAAYFEQCIKAAIDGTMDNGNFVVTYESIIPNLTTLRAYKPMLQDFWHEGLFGPMDERYFRLINRTHTLEGEVRWEALGDYSPFETFKSIFNAPNVGHESYFDMMSHFDFKTLLPALLQVEDRVSMAHGLESRVPILDHTIVELAATIPANIKFEGGTLKRVLRHAVQPFIPAAIAARKDKMGFPTPLVEWVKGEARDFVHDVFSSQAALSRELVDNSVVLRGVGAETAFGRKAWGLLCLELWQQEFHDKAASYRALGAGCG